MGCLAKVFNTHFSTIKLRICHVQFPWLSQVPPLLFVSYNSSTCPWDSSGAHQHLTTGVCRAESYSMCVAMHNSWTSAQSGLAVRAKEISHLHIPFEKLGGGKHLYYGTPFLGSSCTITVYCRNARKQQVLPETRLLQWAPVSQEPSMNLAGSFSAVSKL